MRKLKALFVSKDIGSANVIIPLVKQCIAGGDECTVVVEGLAADKFFQAGINVYFRGTKSVNTEHYLLHAEGVINQVRPDVIVCGESSPIHLERQFARCARELNIPLVVIDDIWGGFKRTESRPNLLLTLDGLGVKVATNKADKVSIVGNPGIPSYDHIISLRKATFKQIESIRSQYDRLISYSGGGAESADEELDLLIGCMQETPGNNGLIVGFHPKWKHVVNQRTNKPYVWGWREKLAVLGDRVHYTDDLGITSEGGVAHSQIMIAGVSTLMTTAMCLEIPVVSLSTPMVLKMLAIETDLHEVPQVTLGWAKKVTEPIDLSTVTEFPVAEAALVKPYLGQVAYHELQSFMNLL